VRTVFQRKDIAHVPDAVNFQNSSQMICARIVNAKKVIIKGEKIMKKTLSLLLAMLLVLSSMLALASCGSGSDSNDEDNKIYLTLENYEQYLDVSAKYYGEDGVWNSLGKDYYYNKIISSASVSSTSPLVKFYNCSITIKITGQYEYGSDTKNTTAELKISLSLGGTGSAKEDTVTRYSNTLHDIKGIGYEVVSVSGYVIVD